MGSIFYSYVRDRQTGNEIGSDAAAIRILAPGTWVRPFFAGLREIMQKWENGETSFEQLERCLSFGHFFLNNINEMIHCQQEHWERCSKSVAVLASPAIQTEVKKYLMEYSSCLAKTFPPLLETGNLMFVLARVFDILAYAAMAEAIVLAAEANATAPNWEQLASNITDLVNAWMGLNAVNYRKEAMEILSHTISKKILHLGYGVHNLYKTFAGGTKGLDALCMPIDVVVQLTTAIERLMALAGSCANFYMPPVQGRPFAKIICPLQPAIETAAILSSVCSISVQKLEPEGCERMWKKAMEASLSALETATKTASLL